MAYHPFIGGAEVAIAEIVRRLPQHQFDIVTVNLDGAQPKIEQIDNVTIHRLGGNALSKYIFPLSAFIYSSRLQRQHCFDLVWSMMANQAGLAGLFFALWFSQVRHVLTLQEGDSERAIWMRTWFMRPLYKLIYRRADAIQAISQYLAQRARAMGYCGRVEVIGNGVPESFFQNTVREVGNTKKTIASVSRFVEKNGIEYLVRAMAHIDARLVLVGDGPLRLQLEQLAVELGVSEKITFIGSVSYEQVPEYLAKADVFVRPSLSEGLGSAFLEAMAMRVPVIATPVGGIVDFMVEGETGWLVNPRDVAQLIEKIQYVLDSDNQEKVGIVIERAHRLVATQYRWDEVAQKMGTLFEQTLNTQKKVLLATGIYPPDIGGPATYSKLLYEKLPAQGMVVSILSFGSVRRYPKIVRHMLYMWKLLWLSRGVDCIYAQDTISVGLPAALVAKIARKPFLIRIPGDYVWEQSQQRFDVTDSIDDFQHRRYGWKIELLRSLQKWVVTQADAVITPSKYFRNLVQGWVADPTKVHHIYNGISFVELDVLDRQGITIQSKTLVSVGRLVLWKGFAELIEMMKLLPDWRLTIIGDGPDRNRLEKIITDADLSHRVSLAGALSRLEMAKQMVQSSIFVLNTSFESFSFQVVEAMYLRVPVITTNIGNLTEIITHQEEGILVAPNSTAEIIAYIGTLETDDDFRRKVVANAHQKSKNFSIDATIGQVVKIISTIC